MLVTIGIPTLDRLEYLKEAVASALAQRLALVEVLVSDDGGSSEIERWTRHLATTEPRVRYHRTSGGVGLAGNWNEIALVARGEYSVIIGDDDRLLPSFVAELLKGANGADVVFSNHFIIDAQGRRLVAETEASSLEYRRTTMQPGLLKLPEMAVWANAIPMSAALVRTACLRRLKFKEDLNTPELEFFARLVEEGGSFAFVPNYLAEYRVHDGSATSRGLTLERLARHLANIPVRAEISGQKAAILSSLLMGAASAALSRGDAGMARRLVRSDLYPSFNRGGLRSRGQVILAHLPAPVLKILYPLASRLLRSVATIRRAIPGGSR